MKFQIQDSEKIKLARQIAIIAGIFSAMVAMVLILNYIQISSGNPLESEALKALVERLNSEPDNLALIEDVRNLDLMVRRAFFNNLWQINTGAYLLLFGSIVLILALRVYNSLTFSIEKPSIEKPKESLIRMKSQKWLWISGVTILGLAGISAVLTADHLKYFQIAEGARVNVPMNEIEQIEITRHSFDTDNVANQGIAANNQADGEALIGIELQVNIPVESSAITLTVEDVTRNFNAFRGAWGHGISGHKNTPTDWDGASGKNILWKFEIPIHGYNSPVLWGDRLFFSGANTSKRVVYSLDRHSGKLLWEREVNNIPGSPAVPPKTTEDTGLAAPSLTVDGQRVFALFGTGDIIAFTHEGTRLWARNLGVPANHYGHSSSLLTWNGKIFVQYDTQRGSKVLALDAITGQTVWETARTTNVSWASPILVPVNGTYQLILSADPYVAAYDIITGKQLWSVDCMSGEVGASPTFGGGLVFAANEYATMVAINPVSGKMIWENRYYLPEVASPVYHNGLLYIATTFAVIACFDAKTGEFIWELDAQNGFYSSPVVVDGKIYFFDLEGQAYIIRPGRVPHLISSPLLGERVYSTPAFADGKIYIRGKNNIYAIGL